MAWEGEPGRAAPSRPAECSAMSRSFCALGRLLTAASRLKAAERLARLSR